VARIAVKVLKDHAKHVGRNLEGRSVLMLTSLPGVFGAEHWGAETRGSNIVLLLGKNSSRGALLARIGIVLTHELFHLWVPNALPLDGNYDWFFEGFTLYQALRSAVRLGFVDFQEYLNTMARVYDSYLATPDRDQFSLIEASQRRWTSSSSLVYDKGMLVAFVGDLILRSASENRRSLDDVYREMFLRFPRAATRVAGNEAIVSLLNEELGSNEFAERYIKRPSGIELETLLAPYGLRVENAGARSSFSVSSGLNKQQRELLRSLGYNRKS
jgi:predicted metalloprotease with PDZ domain